MRRTALLAATLAAAVAGLALSPLVGSAQARDRSYCGPSGYDCPQPYSGSYANDGGLGRYCPPGFYPHSWPNGSGIRCEAADGESWGAY